MMDYLELSPNTRRALELSRPRTRGLSHRLAALLAVPVFLVLVLLAPEGADRTAMVVYGSGTTLMFSVSAIVHLRRWGPRETELLFRLDHTAIYVMIGGTALALASTALEGSAQRWLVILTLAAATIGIVVEWLPFATPEGVGNTIYLTMGWLVVGFMPSMYSHVGLGPILLLVGGGACYTVGAAIVGLRRPDPNPEVFGYHEIWHLLVIAAVVIHTVMFVVLW